MYKTSILLSLAMIFLTIAVNAQNMTIPLWDGDPPNFRESGEVEIRDTSDVVRIRNVQRPDLEVYLPAGRNATGQAVVICPGGGYWILAYDWEGTDIARMLASRGIAAFVLKYRLPGSESNIEPHKSPLMDAQRAIRLVRSRAKEFKIDPAKIGIMGFSAGGHLASSASTHFDQGSPESTDPVEHVSCRPDFSVLMYPVITFTGDFGHQGSRKNLVGEDPELAKYFSSELQVTAETPPAILIHSQDDKSVPIENSLVYFRALVEHGVPAEIHTYPYGGHGYSLAVGQGHLESWPERVVDWIRYITQ